MLINKSAAALLQPGCWLGTLLEPGPQLRDLDIRGTLKVIRLSSCRNHVVPSDRHITTRLSPYTHLSVLRRPPQRISFSPPADADNLGSEIFAAADAVFRLTSHLLAPFESNLLHAISGHLVPPLNALIRAKLADEKTKRPCVPPPPLPPPAAPPPPPPLPQTGLFRWDTALDKVGMMLTSRLLTKLVGLIPPLSVGGIVIHSPPKPDRPRVGLNISKFEIRGLNTTSAAEIAPLPSDPIGLISRLEIDALKISANLALFIEPPDADGEPAVTLASHESQRLQEALDTALATDADVALAVSSLTDLLGDLGEFSAMNSPRSGGGVLPLSVPVRVSATIGAALNSSYLIGVHKRRASS